MQRDFDAHIYFTEQTKELALAMRERAISEFSRENIFISRMVDHKIGPHPLPMFEMIFSKDKLNDIIPWLLKNRDGLTVLIHQVTGHDTHDHTHGAMWMGEALKLDFSDFKT